MGVNVSKSPTDDDDDDVTQVQESQLLGAEQNFFSGWWELGGRRRLVKPAFTDYIYLHHGPHIPMNGGVATRKKKRSPSSVPERSLFSICVTGWNILTPGDNIAAAPRRQRGRARRRSARCARHCDGVSHGMEIHDRPRAAADRRSARLSQSLSVQMEQPARER